MTYLGFAFNAIRNAILIDGKQNEPGEIRPANEPASEGECQLKIRQRVMAEILARSSPIGDNPR
jgi:hypothetical protein